LSDHEKRRHQRFAVHLKVRFASAVDFVTEYADNLSAGGIFVRGAHTLAPLEEVSVALDLPGYDTFEVTGRVARVVGPDLAREMGIRPGAGIEVIKSPEGFDSALTEYLRRLGRRRDVVVLVPMGASFDLIQAAGYNAEPVPEPQQIVATLARSDRPIIGVVVTGHRAPEYQQVMADAGVDDLLHLLDSEDEADALLGALDELL